MKRNLAARVLREVAGWHIALACFFLCAGAALAQSGPPAATNPVLLKSPTQSGHAAKATVPALLLSDIHFEPFWDPAKVPQLVAAPVSAWKAILAAAPSPDQQQRFTALQQNCHARGVDTSYALFDSSLKAMRKPATGAGFVAVSGDLISHAFPCKYIALFPNSDPEAYRTFVEKTLDYVIDELYGAFPGVPVYIAFTALLCPRPSKTRDCWF
jgi:sphingomyelin phosphodiesterase acid-like 3